MFKLIAILLIMSAAYADKNEHNEVRIDVSATIKYFETHGTHNTECKRRVLGITDEDIEAARDYSSFSEMIEARRHENVIGTILRFADEACEVHDRETVKEWLEHEDQDARDASKIYCLKEKLQKIDPDSPLLADFDVNQVHEPYRYCQENIDRVCMNREDYMKHSNELITALGLKSCSAEDLYYGNMCIDYMRQLIARIDKNLPFELRIDNALEQQLNEQKLKLRILECIKQDILNV
jgi:hypothetical protein